jgi:hypothetical protein
MPNFAAMEESWANSKLNTYLSSCDDYDHYVIWCEERGYDPDDEDLRQEYESYMEAEAEDAAIQRYEARMEDERFFGGG